MFMHAKENQTAHLREHAHKFYHYELLRRLDRLEIDEVTIYTSLSDGNVVLQLKAKHNVRFGAS